MLLYALALASVPAALPYKLIIVANDSTVAIDYPNRDRCMRAADVVEREAIARRYRADAEARLEGDVIVKHALRVVTLCIPG